MTAAILPAGDSGRRGRQGKRRRARRRRRRTTAVAAALALLAGAGLAWQGSYSKFVATTGNPSNNWATGTVSLTDSAAGVAVLNNITGLIPGSFGNNCIQVTYTGDLASTVRLYTQNYSGALGPYLSLTIQSGSGPTCAAFGTATTLSSGTLDALRAGTVNFATGLPAASPWSPASNGASRPYRFSYMLLDDNAARSAVGTVDFVWEAQSS